MTSFDPVLVPYDGSAHSRAACANARLIAGPTGASTVILFVASGPDPQVEALLKEEALLFSSPVETRVVAGRPAQVVAAEAERLRAGLVILGTRGRSVVQGLLLGSVARYVLHAASRPVMVVHQAVPGIRRIVVGVDGGENVRAVATVARGLADATSAQITLVHVVETDPAFAQRPERFGIAPDVFRVGVQARAEKLFGAPRPIVGPEAVERVVYGLPVDALRHEAAREGAEIVVVGRRGDSGLDVDSWFSVSFALAIQGPFATVVV